MKNIDVLQWPRKIIKRLQYLSYEERLRELRLFNLEKKGLRNGLTPMHKSIPYWRKERWSQTPPSDALWQDERWWAQLERKELPFKY